MESLLCGLSFVALFLIALVALHFAVTENHLLVPLGYVLLQFVMFYLWQSQLGCFPKID